MKTTTLLALALCLAIASCKKDTPIPTTAITGTVNLNGSTDSNGITYSFNDSVRVWLTNTSGQTLYYNNHVYRSGQVGLGSQPAGTYTIHAATVETGSYMGATMYRDREDSCTFTAPAQSGCTITFQ